MNENVECSETKMNLRVTLDWRTTLATVMLIPTLLFLGFWQLDRADEKVDLIARMDERRVLPPRGGGRGRRAADLRSEMRLWGPSDRARCFSFSLLPVLESLLYTSDFSLQCVAVAAAVSLR